ncbi:M15 family metallopeptidase [Candidatus Peregrinibacteria bacterium]|nr:MAG: M15 family metallopeptidase [Candidatus Peregrinibacteria bacterium]
MSERFQQQRELTPEERRARIKAIKERAARRAQTQNVLSGEASAEQSGPQMSRRQLLKILAGGSAVAVVASAVGIDALIDAKKADEKEAIKLQVLKEERAKAFGKTVEEMEADYVFYPEIGNYLEKDSIVAKAVEGYSESEREVVVLKLNGEYVKDKDGNDVRMTKALGKKFEAAFKKMQEDDEKLTFQFNSSFRDNNEQAGLHKNKVTDKKVGQRTLAAKPGTSMHETGLAVDIQNWTAVQTYLAEQGVFGGMYTNRTTSLERTAFAFIKKDKIPFRVIDPVHFSIGEFKDVLNPGETTQEKALRSKEIAKRMIGYLVFVALYDQKNVLDEAKRMKPALKELKKTMGNSGLMQPMKH